MGFDLVRKYFSKGVLLLKIICSYTTVLLLSLVASAQRIDAATCPSLGDVQHMTEQAEWKIASQNLGEVIRTYPACADARYLFGFVLLHEDQPDASLRAYTQAAKLRPPTSSEFVGVASDYVLLKAYTEAERWLLQAVKTIPVDPQAWYLLGRTQYNLDRNAAAVDSFKHSLSVLPEDSRSEYNLGLAYERLQQPDLAREAYQTAIRWNETKHVTDAQPYLDLAVLDRSQGSIEEALPLLQKAAELSPNNPLIFQELGRTLSEMGSFDEAIVALQRSIAIAPSAEQPHFFLGRAYRAVGKAQEADEQFRIVHQLLDTHSDSGTPNTSRPR